MDDGKLTFLIQENDEIYNKSSPLYKFPDRKKAVWLKIAKEMGTTDEICIRRWTSLRDRYTRECRQNIRPSGSGTFAKSTWPLFETMQFLKPHVASRPTRGSTNVAVETLEYWPTDFKVSLNSSPSPSPSASPCEPQQTLKPNKKREIDVDTVFCEAVETFKNVCGGREVKNCDPSVQAFGDMIVATICDMDAKYRVRAMREATDLIMGIKLENDNFVAFSYIHASKCI